MTQEEKTVDMMCYSPSADEMAEIDNWFMHHPPKEGQAEAYTVIRATAKELAKTILMLVPPCADRSTAIRKLRECVMTANAGIACNQ